MFKTNRQILKFLKIIPPWPLHFGTGMSTVKMAAKFEISSSIEDIDEEPLKANPHQHQPPDEVVVHTTQV